MGNESFGDSAYNAMRRQEYEAHAWAVRQREELLREGFVEVSPGMWEKQGDNGEIAGTVLEG